MLTIKKKPQKPSGSPAPTKKRSILQWVKWLLWCIFAIIFVFHLLIVALLFLWKTQPINNSMFMVLHRISYFEGVNQTWVESNQIPDSVKRAAIASEDAKFFGHAGFDIQGIENAIKKNQQQGTISAGGSTISQQLAKNLFLFPQRSYVRKAEEVVITLMLELMWEKQRILVAYLNVAEFGKGIYGIEAASQYYYQKPAKQLNKREAALLIAMLPDPKYYQTHLNDKRLLNKTQIILRRMDTVNIPKGI